MEYIDSQFTDSLSDQNFSQKYDVQRVIHCPYFDLILISEF